MEDGRRFEEGERRREGREGGEVPGVEGVEWGGGSRSDLGGGEVEGDDARGGVPREEGTDEVGAEETFA